IHISPLVLRRALLVRLRALFGPSHRARNRANVAARNAVHAAQLSLADVVRTTERVWPLGFARALRQADAGDVFDDAPSPTTTTTTTTTTTATTMADGGGVWRKDATRALAREILAI